MNTGENPETNAPPASEDVAGGSVRPGGWFWLLMAVSLAAVGGVAYLQYARVHASRTGGYSVLLGEDGGAPPVIAQLPDFSLTERSGRTVTLGDLRGRVWIADFIFTTCGGPCPIMTRRLGDLMDTIEARNIPNVTAVSFTVDPETDTPAVLREYATMKLADDHDWLFLTGTQAELHDLSVKGFMLTAEPGDESHEVSHSPRFVLVDQRGRIRGYYEVVTNEEILAMEPGKYINEPMRPDVKAALIADIMTLLREESGQR